MPRTPGLVSEIYQPEAPNAFRDQHVNRHYETWGYSLGYEMAPDGQAVPEGGNTAVFRIMPKGMTEPVFVTKPEPDATFTVSVLAGQGRLIRAGVDGEVEQIELAKGAEVVIRPGEAYFYQNTDERSDLILHDVALPAFNKGDDIELTASRLYYSNIPEDREGYKACVAVAHDHKLVTMYVPDKFWELAGGAAATSEELSDPYVGDLIVSSLRFSQGDKYLGARSLATIIHSHPDRFPRGRISEGAIAAAVPIAQHIRNHAHPKYLAKATGGEAALTSVDVEKVIREQLVLMEDYAEELPETELPAIAAMMLQRDARFLLYPSPLAGVDKPGRLPTGHRRGPDTTFLSHYCYYGLTGHKTGSTEYDELFTGITSPEAIRALPEVDLTQVDVGDGEFQAIRNVKFPIRHLQAVLKIHFEQFPDDLEQVPEPQRVALRDVLGTAVAEELGF